MTEQKHRIKPYPLGAHPEEGGIRFAHASRNPDCGILIYDRESGKRLQKIPFGTGDRMGDIYCRYEKLDPERIAYQFYEGDRMVPDSRARGFRGKLSYGKSVRDRNRLAIFPQEAPELESDSAPELSYAESVVYCMHVRGFTMHPSSGVKPEQRGTFAGIVEKLPYLQEIGVTTVELQPVYEFDEVPEKPAENLPDPVSTEKSQILPGYRVLNYWGYRKGYYYAPKSAYASTENAVEEFGKMVCEFHKRKMEVVLQFYFPKGMNPSEIGEILRFWVLQYHVDGFHLMGEEIPMQMLAMDPALRRTKLWYYSFDPDSIYGAQEEPSYRNLAEYQDDYLYTARKFLKGDDNMLSGVLYQMRHIPPKMGRIHYFSNYYGFTMMDMVSYDHKHNEANGEGNRDGNDYNCSWNCGEEGVTRRKKVKALRLQQLKNAFAILLLTQSTPLIFMGDEFGNSQQGNNNPYCQDNKITWINWQDKEKNAELLACWKQLMKLRKCHPILHPEKELRLFDSLSCGYPDLSYHGQNAWRPQMESYNRHVGLLYCGKYAPLPNGEDDTFLYIAMNMHWEAQELALPKLPKGMVWELRYTTAEGQKLEKKGEFSFAVAPRSVMVLEAVPGAEEPLIKAGKKKKELV